MIEERPVRKRVAVLGAGPSGLAAAYELSKNTDLDVHVFESESEVGGLSRSVYLWNRHLSFGPQRFYLRDKRALALWNNLLGKNCFSFKRKSAIFFENKKFAYPFSRRNILKNTGFLRPIKYFSSFLKEKFKKPNPPRSLEEWLINRFGELLYHDFFRDYGEKLWGLSCSQIEAFSSAQRIGGLSLLSHLLKANKGQSRFLYPIEGPAAFYDKMAFEIQGRGASLFLSRPVKGLWTNGKNEVLGIEMCDGEFLGYDYVLSTLPHKTLLSSVKECPKDVKEALLKIKSRNTVVAFVEIPLEKSFKEQCIYVQDKKLYVGRITNYNNFEMNVERKSVVLGLEFWCHNEDFLWNTGDAQILEVVKLELKSLGMIAQDSDVLRMEVFRLPRSYPIYSLAAHESTLMIKDYLKTLRGIHIIQKNLAYRFGNQDSSILKGIEAANICTEFLFKKQTVQKVEEFLLQKKAA